MGIRIESKPKIHEMPKVNTMINSHIIKPKIIPHIYFKV